MVGGRWIVRDGEHVSVADVADRRSAEAIDRGVGGRVTTLVVDRIGLLVTNDPSARRRAARARARRRGRDRGRTGRRRDAGRRGRRRADRRRRAAASCPASSTATPTWCSPATGPRSSPPAWPAGRTRPAASASRPRRPAPPATTSSGGARRRGWPRPGPGGTTHVEIKSGYALDVEGEARLLPPGRRADRRRRPSSAPTSCPAEYAGRADDYVDARRRADARRLRAVVPLDRRLLRGRRLRRRPVPRRARGRPRPAASGCGSTPTSSAPAPACSWPSSSARRRPTTAPT